MTNCERIEMELSAMMDGEVPPCQVIALFDHILGCPACQEFYRQLRLLERVVSPPDAEAPKIDGEELVWAEIERKAGLTPSHSPRILGLPTWVLRMAAMLVVVAGLWGLGMLRLPAFAVVRDGMEIRVEEDRGKMTDEQFIQLAVTVLKSDRKYQRKMLEILQTVSGEGASSRSLPLVRRVETEDPSHDRGGQDSRRGEDLSDRVKVKSDNV